MPGPFTIILKKKDIVPNILTANGDTVGIRMPENDIALKLIQYVGYPIATPSANISGKQSGICIKDIMKDFGNQNDKITSMWENVKVNPLPVWVSVIVVLGFVGILGFLGSYRIIQKIKVNRRKKLREKNN